MKITVKEKVSSAKAAKAVESLEEGVSLEKVAFLTRPGSEKWREMDQRSFKAAAKKTFKAMTRQQSTRSVGRP